MATLASYITKSLYKNTGMSDLSFGGNLDVVGDLGFGGELKIGNIGVGGDVQEATQNPI
jgi:hypothetical protein